MANCPVDAIPLEEAGQTLRCSKCEGAWIAEDALVAILEQRASTLVRNEAAAWVTSAFPWRGPPTGVSNLLPRREM